MAFAAVEFAPSAEDGNKESSLFWAVADDDDFFDKYVMLDVGDESSSSTTTTADDDAALLAQLMDQMSPAAPPPALNESSAEVNNISSSHTVGVADLGQLRRDLPANNNSNGLGSILDSGLLRLEGLSVCSPGLAPAVAALSVSVPSSPLLLPPPPPLADTPCSASKRPGRLENLYSTIRRATTAIRRPRLPQQGLDGGGLVPETVAPAQTLRTVPTSQHHHYREAANTQQHDDNDSSMDFVTGYVEDPFFTFHDSSSWGVGGAGGWKLPEAEPRTPLPTPLPDGNISSSGNGGVSTHSTASWPAPPPRRRPPTTAAAEMTPPAMADHQWTSGAYLPNSTSAAAAAAAATAAWWPGPQPAMDTLQLADTAASFNLAMHLQQSGLPYEYGSGGGGDLSSGGLMIHMPQPRGPPLANIDVLTAAHQQSPYQQQQQQFATTTPRHRRPKPRAPSSGARHHHLQQPQQQHEALTSPRKRSSSSSSLPPVATGSGGGRSSSSPSAQHHHLRNNPTSPCVRKRRSWTGGATQGSSGGSSSHNRRSWSSSTGEQKRRGGGGAVGFVNLTPDDHTLLMTGVAPSGSSKTKARREREAAERQRKLSEAFVKVVEAAGGDVGKLKQEGIVMM